jgi:hypothetical protein
MIPTIDREHFSRDSSGSPRSIKPSDGAPLPYTLLIAASPREDAHESSGRGWFTRAVLDLMRDPSVRAEALTYTELINRIPDMPLFALPLLTHTDRN